jgi:hypothetical protein
VYLSRRETMSVTLRYFFRALTVALALPAVASAQIDACTLDGARQMSRSRALPRVASACEALRASDLCAQLDSAGARDLRTNGRARPDTWRPFVDACCASLPLCFAGSTHDDELARITRDATDLRDRLARPRPRPGVTSLTAPVTVARPADETDDDSAGALPLVVLSPVPATASEPAMAFTDVMLDGISQHVARNGTLDAQIATAQRIRHELCNPPLVTSEALTDEQKRQLLSATVLQTTCAFLGDHQDQFSTTLGPAFTAAVSRDVVLLPRRYAQLWDRFLMRRDGIVANDQALVARVTVELVAAMLESPVPAHVASRAAAVVNAWRCPDGDARVNCESTRRGLAAIFAAVDLVSRSRDGAAGADDDYERALRATLQATLVAIFRAGSSRDAGLAGTSSAIDEADRGHIEQGLRAIDRWLPALEREDRHLRALFAQFNRRAGDGERRDDVAAIARSVINLVNVAIAMAEGFDESISFRIPSDAADLFGAVSHGTMPRFLAAVIPTIEPLQRHVMPDVTLPGETLRVLSFGSDLAVMPSPDQTTEVVSSFVPAPQGGWSARNRRPTASLALHLGVGAGVELFTSTRLTAYDTAARASLVAAFGFEYTRPLGSGSIGVFFPLVDLGALATASTVTFAPLALDDRVNEGISPWQFIAPGVYLRVGFSGVPIALGAGVSFLPAGRRVAVTAGPHQGEDVYVPAITGGGFVSVDLPTFTF